ncbi:MAG TPA: hypothetical protein VLW85_14205 [Myxococcales bacterium]|nr:hypothetical protein [Myxococcales bacterium]
MAAWAVAIAACGGGAPGLPPGESSSCTVSLSGAISGSWDCKPATTVFTPSQNISGFAFEIPPADPQPEIQVGIIWAGQPAADAHYRNTDAGATASLSVISGRGTARQAWGACINEGCPVEGGSYDLHLTSVANPVDTSSGTAWNAEGTLSATLPSGGNLYGTVTMTVTF